MTQWFEISKIALGIDLATSFALIASAIGVLWRVTVLSRRIQEKQLEAQKEEAQKIILVHRERARIDFLLSTNDELQENILKLKALFMQSTRVPPAKNGMPLDSQIINEVKKCWDWLQQKEAQFVAIGTSDQVLALKRAQRHFISTVGAPDKSATHLNPREMVSSLKNFQKAILVDIRIYLFSEEREDAIKFIDENIFCS